MSCYITYKGKNYTQEDFLDFLKTQIPSSSTSSNPSEFVNHSGGAKGYDAEWDIIGSEYGMVNNKHYLLPEDGEVSDLRLRGKGVKPVDATNDIGHVAKTGLAIGGAQIAVTNAERAMGRIESNHTTRNTKKIRNYAQVKNADGIFAIGSLIPKGAEITIARGQETKIALVPQVNGGTSVAVQLGIMQEKPTYVFNQVGNSVYSQGWYKWDNTVKDFVSTETPTLTKNFAGIGTSSNTTEAGKQAIRDVYEKTFNKPNSTNENTIAPGFVQASEIYNKLGNKTVSNNVKIVKTYQQAGVNYAEKNNAVFSLRVDNSEHHFGNPFSPVKAEIEKGLTAVSTTKEAVERYIAWVINSNQPRAEWIREQLKSGQLKGKDIIYYKELGEPSHATALDYLINNWEEISGISNNTSYYEGDIVPEPNTVFVFGSNPLGINGNPSRGTGGAALVASQQFGVKQGEKMDNKLSDSGNAYGLTTVSAPGRKKSMTPEQITEGIIKLYETATSNPNKQFKVAYRNTTTTSLNGYTGLEMIEMFKQAGPIPSNIVFSKEWYDVISKETSSQVGQTFNNETSTDTYQYYGAKYEVITVDGVGVKVKDYRGSHQNHQKLLQAYNNNKDIDPQTGRKFRNLSLFEEIEQKINGGNGTSDTLNLSKYELFPGVYANEGQKAAIDAIEEFLAGDKELFLLKGRGGTGKTTIVKKTIGEIPVKKVAGATIAYEAKNVLQENMVGYNTFTMASLIGLMPDWAKDGTMFFREKTIAERMNPSTGEIYPLPIEGKKLIIVDEASMIDSFIYEKLLEKKDKDAKILFMGDNVQIPPINSRVDEDGNVIDSGDKDSPVWGLVESGDYVELSERMRQGAESPILPITDLYAENVENLQNNRPGIDNPLKDRNSNFENNEGVLFTMNVDEVTDQFIEDVRSSTDTREAVIVGARNAVVDEINDKVRAKLFETDEAYVIGDRLRVNSPHMEGKDLIYPNGLRVEVLAVKELDTSDLGFKMFELETSYIEVAEDGSNKIIKSFMRTISPKDKSLFSKKIKEMAAKAKALPKGSRESKRAWAEFFDIKNSVVDLGYGYAITAHKVQGSTYNSAYVLEGDIMSFPGGVEQRNRMMYTAVSRPRKKLVIFNPNKVEDKVTTSKPQVKPIVKDTAAKIKSLFDTQGFIEIDTANKTNKELIVIISNYILEELGHVTPQKKLEAVQSGFKLSNYITTEEISPTRTRVKTNMSNLLKDEVEDVNTPMSLGGINFTSSGDSYAKNAFTCK